MLVFAFAAKHVLSTHLLCICVHDLVLFSEVVSETKLLETIVTLRERCSKVSKQTVSKFPNLLIVLLM